MRAAVLILITCLLLAISGLFEVGQLPKTTLGWALLPAIGAALVLLEGTGEMASRSVRRFLTPLGIFAGAILLAAIVLVSVLA